MSVHVLRTTQTVRVPVACVLAFIQDPVKLCHMNPLVVDVAQSPTDPSSYIITDKMMVFGIFSFRTRYEARFTMIENGVVVDIHAPFNVKLKNQWSVEECGGESCEVTETVLTVEANVLIKPHIIYTLRKSHKELVESLVRRVEEESNTQAVPEFSV